ncbi:MAG TPA: porin family protein [Steroidobacteraceae bacterium]|nr:porin family protein [Steroidobacteraceae bacterium]
MKSAGFVIRLCFLALLPLAAQADPPASVTGFYVGLDVGQSKLQAKLSQQFFGPEIARQSGDDVGVRVRGGYQFSRFVAVEASYVDFGKFEMSGIPYNCPGNVSAAVCSYSLSAETQGFSTSVIGSWPFADGWSLNARIGAVYMEGTTHERDPAIPASTRTYSDNNSGVMYGVGIGYRFNEHLGVNVDWQQYDQFVLGLRLSGSAGTYDVGSSKLISAGVSYRF